MRVAGHAVALRSTVGTVNGRQHTRASLQLPDRAESVNRERVSAEGSMADLTWAQIVQNGSDVVQSIGVIAALLFTGWEMRTRAREQKYRNYLDAVSGFVNLASLMVERPSLQAIYEYSPNDLAKTYEQLSPEERAQVNYCDAMIALCETVWVASEKGWLAEDEWLYWRSWAHELNGSPVFRWTLAWVRTDYDEGFVDELKAPAPNTSVRRPRPRRGSARHGRSR
jgi:hypothetical protein